MHASNGPAPDVAVVGGGIVGAAAAAFLAEAGARVVLVEREGLASGASGANSGVVQHPFDPVLAALYHETLAHHRALAAGSAGFRFAAEPSGMLFVSAEEVVVRQQADRISDAFPVLRVDVLGGEELLGVEPTLAPDLWACRVDIGFPVMPGASTYAFATLAESLGAQVRQGRAAELTVEGDVVVGIRVEGRLVPAGAVVVAAGPWTPELLDPSGRWAPIRPRWGVVVEAEIATPPRHVLEAAGIDEAIGGAVTDGAGDPRTPPGGPHGSQPHELDFSLVPLPGAAAVGSTFLSHEPDPQDWLERILAGATRFVPGVADAPIRGVRACARPQSVDGLPLVGAVPGLRGAFVCAGHGPWGVSTGPASARMIADLVLGRGPGIPRELDPDRFGAPRG
jgi:glycine/D-amino acid oxidase-like deaminating enzyme